MVEWIELGQLGQFENIGTDKKINEGEKLVTLLNYVDVYHHKYIDSSIPQMQVSASDKKIRDCTVEQGDIYVTPSSETVDDIGHSSVITETIPNAVYSYHIMRYRLFQKNMLLSYYINYAFDTECVKKQILKKAQGLTRFGLSKDKFASIQIPLPSLSEQNRIVGILDTFTDSIENLKQQIAQRRKQYEHYRDQLLDLEEKEGVEMKALCSVCIIGDGIHGTPQYDENGDYYFINGNNLSNGHIIIKSDTKRVSREVFSKYGIGLDMQSILMSINGTIGNIALYKEENIVLGKSAAYLKVIALDTLHYKYLYYILQTTNAIDYYESKLTGSTIKNLGLKALRSFEIPIPSFQEQSRIVSILDTFEASISNLEAQLKERQKQYEYYRNKLLSFEKEED